MRPHPKAIGAQADLKSIQGIALEWRAGNGLLVTTTPPELRGLVGAVAEGEEG